MFLPSDAALHVYTDLSASFTGLFSDPGSVPGESPQFCTLQAYILTYIPSSCLPVLRLPSPGTIGPASHVCMSLGVQFGFTPTATFPLTSLTSHHNLLVRWRRVDPHPNFLFDFSRSQGQPNVFVVRMPSQAITHFHPL
jgi:hypothetical protein